MKEQNTKTPIILDLNEVVAQDLNGTIYEISDIHKNIGNLIFMHSIPIELDAIARTLHAKESAEATVEDLVAIRSIIDSNPIYMPFVMKAIINHINSLITKNQ